jgi:hypothetical protein
MRTTRSLLAVLALAALTAGGSAASASPMGTGESLLGNGDSFTFTTPGGYPVNGECHWRGSASDQGTDAVLYGYASTGGPAAGTTIHCWLRKTSPAPAGVVPSTESTTGAPGAAAATTKQIVVPAAPVVTKVCAEARTLYVDGSPPGYYKTTGC